MLSNNSDDGGYPPSNLSISESFRQCLSSGLVSINKELEINALNYQAEKLLSIKAAFLLNQSIHKLPAPLPDLITETFETGKGVKDRQIVLSSGGQFGRSCLINGSLIGTGDGGNPSVILLINDYGLIGELETNIRRLDRLSNLGTLSTSIAHEIKNAMQAMSTFVDTFIIKSAQAQIMREPDEQKLMSLAADELKRIRGLVNQMLRFAGSDKPTFSPLPVQAILNQTLTLIRHQLEGRKINLRIDFQSEHDLVDGDLYQLEQAFLNIFLNAIEAMSSDGRLTLCARPLELKEVVGTRSMIEITVKDTGVGIASEDFSRLFDTFFTTKKDGTGLGLSITKRIIKEHGGEIAIESTVNAGTTVIIRLPLSSAPART